MAFYNKFNRSKPMNRRITKRLLLLKKEIRGEEEVILPEKTIESKSLITIGNICISETKIRSP
jgi:hypothetical protein